jgi:uncharacterized protein (DUF2267 family)
MKEEEFLKRVQTAGGLPSRKEAEHWSAEVLRALSHILSEAEVRRHFISQLPGGLKSRLLMDAPRALTMERDAFIQHIASALGVHAPEGARALKVVYGVLKEALPPGQIADLEAHISKELVVFLEQEA